MRTYAQIMADIMAIINAISSTPNMTPGQLFVFQQRLTALQTELLGLTTPVGGNPPNPPPPPYGV